MTIPTAPLVSTVSDLIAAFLVERGCKHVFGVVGAGNMRVVDAVVRHGIEMVCTHSEQAAAQAAIGYYRASGRIAPVLVTCGAGASNVVTGVVSAWMDSVPLFVIAGQESRRDDRLRAYGVQGFSLSAMTDDVSKISRMVTDAKVCKTALDYMWWKMSDGRPGPVVIEVPMDVQGHAL